MTDIRADVAQVEEIMSMMESADEQAFQRIKTFLLEQLAAPADLVRRLLADHQRVEPHHADQCQLCLEATAAIDGQPAPGERKPVGMTSVGVGGTARSVTMTFETQQQAIGYWRTLMNRA